MHKSKKVIPFIKKSTKVADRTQAEIMRDRKEKRDALLKRLKDKNR